MPAFAADTKATIVSCLLYRDATAAVEWLCSTFGFEKHAVYAGESGKVEHAELSFGNGLIMCGPRRDSPFGRLIKQPDEIDGCETQTVYLIVTDADAVYERAKTSGAEIVLDIKDEDYGGRGFTCRDSEGHIWTFGTYDPWKKKP
jgi:uncharacterized glyoxalase superfamily protein PhnB